MDPNVGTSYGVQFGNNCWRMSVFPDYKGTVYVGLRLQSLPFNVRNVGVSYELTVHCDDKTFIKNSRYTFSLDIGSNQRNCEIDMFDSKILKETSYLVFVIKITVKQFKYYDE